MSSRCLSLSWDWQRGTTPARGFSFDAVYRYATVELIARFDKSCLGKEVICTDRASVLLDARAIHVLKRRPSALGLGSRSERDRLVDAPAETTADLTTLLADGFERGPAGPDYRAYAYQSDPVAAKAAVICRSYGKDDNAKWPIDAAAVLAPSSEDRFRCYWADRSDGRWFIHPD
ncbi:hypothetical protein [Sphingomonas glacialis]|uniref:hypothetical protein n=1 Tax=Sphingomonas glacialis TaxID=658225 RepID=UPI001387477B|nr:hypothetical protein [Sphingomonas glacialis]